MLKINSINFSNTKSYINSPKCNANRPTPKIACSKDTVSFKGKTYHSDYYTDEEIEYAKKYLNVYDWENRVRAEIIYKDSMEMSTFQFCFTKASKRRQEYIVNRVTRLMAEMKKDIIERRNAKLIKYEERFRKAKITKIAKDILKNRFLLNLIQDKNKVNVPTAIMIEDGDNEMRSELLAWIKKNAPVSIIETEHLDRQKTNYRIEAEAEYAEKRYKTSKQRTIIIIKNFENMLTEEDADLKRVMFDLSKKRTPLTIIFETQSSENILEAYKANARRIPLKIKLDNALIERYEKLAEIEKEKKLKAQPPKFEEIHDGFVMKSYALKPEGIELYPGDCGKNEKILWISSSNIEEIKYVLQKINEIKKLEKFKNIEKIQCPSPHAPEIPEGFSAAGKYTYDGNPIIEKII